MTKNRFSQIMRSLHRDIALITIGFSIGYALSGILLVYRNTDFWKKERTFEMRIAKGISAEKLGGALFIRNLTVQKEENGIYYFKQGHYNSLTGEAVITKFTYPRLADKMVNLHKMSGNSKFHWISTVYGAMLFFLVVTSFFMFSKKIKLLRRLILMISASMAIVLMVLWIM